MSESAAPSPNQRWADLLVEELVRAGVGLFCLAPGSRSTPLTAAVAANPKAQHVVHFDERGTAFCALGYARATGRPAAWITTSGTAVANGLPAVVEASVDGVPLLLLTADRPPELRDTGANQTIPQPSIFGDYVRWRFDLPVPTEAIDPAFVLTTADQAVYRATGRPAGPVHLNCMFREPLAPEVNKALPIPEALQRWADSVEPYTRYTAPSAVEATEIEGLIGRLRAAERGLVVAGRLRTRAEGAWATMLAEALDWPLLPDIASQVRLGTISMGACAGFDHALGSEGFAAAHAPDAVVYLGGRSTSKRLGQYLARHRPATFVVVRDDPFRFDPHHLVTDRVVADVTAFCKAFEDDSSAADPAWLDAWRTASDAALGAIAQRIEASSVLTEPATARLAAGHAAHAGHGLVLAASMPVRDADSFASPYDDDPPLVVSNRGASGIDGTVATAAGVARGLGTPVTLLIGDLALLHDLNSLALLRDPAQPPVTVVVVNNDGGGIFHFLPIAQNERLFEPYFGTPHGLGFEHAARMFGLPYARPETPTALAEALAGTQRSGASSLIEVPTDRTANRALHADLLARAAAAVTDTLSSAAPTP
ncbi:MAG: 2-succinyl-5-enolpyruvyl-6-hydroxy-3-cyclohexene-1-carboxylic-acid synthase [Rhodothermales bacterium]